MVNKVLSRYTTRPPKEDLTDGAERIIDNGGPLYGDILEILDSCEVKLATSKCSSDLALNNLEVWDVRDWIRDAVRGGNYLNSQWCSISNKGAIVACDAYLVRGTIETKANEMVMLDMYVKFCVSKTGKAIMTVSFHQSSFVRG